MIKSKNFPYVEDDILLDKITSEDIKKEHVDTLNDKEYLKYSQQRFYKHTKESINKYICSQNKLGNYFLKAVVKHNHVGNIGIKINRFDKIANLSILIFKNYCASGFGKRIFKCSLNLCYKIKYIEKIEAGTYANNKAMIALMKSSKMKKDGIRKSHHVFQGKRVDCVYFSIFK